MLYRAVVEVIRQGCNKEKEVDGEEGSRGCGERGGTPDGLIYAGTNYNRIDVVWGTCKQCLGEYLTTSKHLNIHLLKENST